MSCWLTEPWLVRSNKCGAECRQSRKWQYESLEVEGMENRLKKNLHLVKRPWGGKSTGCYFDIEISHHSSTAIILNLLVLTMNIHSYQRGGRLTDLQDAVRHFSSKLCCIQLVFTSPWPIFVVVTLHCWLQLQLVCCNVAANNLLLKAPHRRPKGFFLPRRIRLHWLATSDHLRPSLLQHISVTVFFFPPLVQ